jgi:hypothetical protein
MPKIRLKEAILQKGPTCGFVMLAYMSCISAQDWLERGKESNLTKSGELFNIRDLCNFTNHYGLETIVETFSWERIIEHLKKGSSIGIAYDSDKNHEPFNANGSCAHWGLIHGYSFSPSLKYTLDLSINDDLVDHEGSLNDLCFLIRQGKSKYSKWIPCQVLQESNAQLKNPKDLDPNFFKLDDLSLNLANLIIVFN